MCCVLLSCIASLVRAQDVLYSEYEKFDYRNDAYSVVGMCGGRLYTYVKQGGNAMLNAYDDSMNKLATVLLDFFPARIYETRFIAYPDKIIALYQGLEGNKVIQYAALLDEKGRLKGRPVELGNEKTGIFGATQSYFSSAVSENKKWILVYSAEDDGSEVKFEGKWLDDQLVIQKRSKATFKTDNRVEHGEVHTGNDGTVYMAAYTTVGAQDYADQYWILTLPVGGNKFEPKELMLHDLFAAGGYMKLDNTNGKVYFGGFYSTKKNGGYDGVVFSTLDMAAGSVPTGKLLPFDEKLVNAAGNRRRGHPFDNFQVRQLIVKNDGGFVLISEEEYVITRSNYTPGFGYYSAYSPYMTNTVREYHFDDILSLSYNADATLQWHSFIRKDQYSQEDGGVFSSYALLNTGGTLAFLFNDYNARRSTIQLATLSSDGQTNVRGFAAEGNDYPDWLPKSGKQVAARTLVVPCFHKRQICFARVEL